MRFSGAEGNVCYITNGGYVCLDCLFFAITLATESLRNGEVRDDSVSKAKP